MAEFKARVVLAPDVHKVINYLTNNINTEIGAVGKVKIRQEDGEKYFYVYKLLFPQQQVSGATVHFTPAMWGSLIKKYGLAALSDVAWYWHRHPGNATHSQTDEEETFETFMDKKQHRKFFIYYQTAISSSNEWNQEVRIDIRNPIRATILGKDISLENEQDEDDDRIEKLCEQIVGDAIVKEEIVTYKETKALTSGKRGQYFDTHKCLGDTYEMDGNKEILTYLNNDILDGYATEDKDKASINFEHGQVTIRTGTEFLKVLIRALQKGGKMQQLVRKWKTTEGINMKQINLQPTKKNYQLLKETILAIYEAFNYLVIEGLKKDFEDDSPDDEDPEDEIINIINNPDLAKKLISQLANGCKVEWKDAVSATVYDSEMETIIGEIEKDSADVDVTFLGENLVAIIGANKEFQDEREMKKVLDKEIRGQNDTYMNGFYSNN